MDYISNYCLVHYGIKGMRWGVRRYQNYDGSYTRRGLERYRKAEASYNEAKENYKSTKSSYKQGKATRQDLAYAKDRLGEERAKEKKAYKRLKEDHMADQGKKLYAKGKTITINSLKRSNMQVLVLLGSAATAAIVTSKTGSTKLASLYGGMVAVGGTAVNMLLGAKNEYENRRLRAYYAH